MTGFRPEDWLAKPHGLAQRLREAREARGMQAKEVGEALKWDPAKVSRTESGKRVPTRADIEAWSEVTGLDEAKTAELLAMLEQLQSLRSSFRERMRHGRASLQNEYAKLYADTRRFRIFQVVWIPGILQVADYARQIFNDLDEITDTPRNIDADVQARMSRQQYLYDTEKTFEILVLESALRLLLVDPPVMHAQLDRLLSVIGLQNVRFGIVPMGSRLSTAPQNSFVMYDDMAVVEGFHGETRHFAEEASLYAKIMDRLWVDAVEGEAARQLIVAAQKLLPHAREQ